MATSANYKDFVLEQLVRCNDEFLGRGFAFSARKLFGEYCVYIESLGDLRRVDLRVFA
ncbi:hypothetical protein ACWIWK_00335 [Helicobacter sp. 23-1048]